LQEFHLAQVWRKDRVYKAGHTEEPTSSVLLKSKFLEAAAVEECID
jgi:hypothetical protein